MADAVEFTAPCPLGHAGARWRAALQTVLGETSDDYLGAQRPQYVVDCAWCPPGAGGDRRPDDSGPA